MRILIWNECYRSGGQDQNVIDLINNWPDENDRFLIAINRTHEGIDKIKRHTNRHADIVLFPFKTLLEIWESSFWKRVRSVSVTLFRLMFGLYFITTYLPLNVFKSYRFLTGEMLSAVLVNSGGFPGLTNSFVFPAFIAFLKNVKKRIMVIHNFPPPGLRRYEAPISSMIIKKCFQIVIMVSETLKASYSSFPFYSKTQVILNGVDVGESEVNLWQGFSNPIVAGIFGELHPRKGHKTLLDAIRRVEDKLGVRLIIVGRGTSEEHSFLVKYVETIALRSDVVFKDFLPDCKPVMAECDIVVQPSIAYESFGRVAAEAQGLGRPVIVSDEGGLKEVVSNGLNGLMFKAGNGKDLAEKFLMMVQNEAKTREMVQKGRELYLKKFSSKRMAREYCRALHDLQ